MRIQRLQITTLASLTLCLAGCAANTTQVQHEVGNKSARAACAADFTTDNQGHRAARVIRNPEADSGFVSGQFPADIKVWVTAPGTGTKLVTLHATAADNVIPIPVERITAVALQSCEATGDPDQGAAQRVLTTSN